MTSEEYFNIIKTLLKDNKLFHQLFSNLDIKHIIERYTEPHRYYHNIQHILDLMYGINLDKDRIRTEHQKEMLMVVALFHDIHYAPVSSGNNERRSAEIFKGMIIPDEILDISLKEDISNIICIIRNTKYSLEEEFTSPVAREAFDAFVYFDLIKPLTKNMAGIISDRMKIFKEFQNVPVSTFRSVSFIVYERLKGYIKTNYPNHYDSVVNNINSIQEWLNDFRPKVGFYPGSFNPFHKGHMNILEKAEKLFDKVIIGFGVNPEKNDYRKDDGISILPFHERKKYYGLLTDVVKDLRIDGCDVTLIRGLRNGYDLNYEMVQNRYIRDLDPTLNVIFISSDYEYDYLSSSSIKSLGKLADINDYLPNKYKYAFEYYSREIPYWSCDDGV